MQGRFESPVGQAVPGEPLVAPAELTEAPFIFLSGTIGEDNAVLALQRGAVDYVIKDRPARPEPKGRVRA